jgi:nitrite reductase/ring-hydroxylating ferredoxin subunit
MDADTPMRLRRGELRSRGYKFIDDEDGNGFLETINLQTVGVVSPSSVQPLSWVSEADKLPQGSTYVGTDDVAGVRIVREQDNVMIFPRVCLHAGASLDDAKVDGDCIVCPWHGKRIQPLAVLVNAKPVSTDNSRGVAVRVENRLLTIDGSLTL